MKFRPGTALPPPSDQRIAWFEDAYEVVLPPGFVALLKVGNGAIPITNLFDQSNRERMIERMLCILDRPGDDQVDGWYDITVVMTQIEDRLIDDEDLIGRNVIPFASLFAGDFVCLDYRANPESPTIAVWDHELSDVFQPVLETVATSIEEFDAMLRSS